MTWELHHHDARHISDLIEPESVDLIVTSPPYFALRSYRDGGEHYDGQLGSEPTPSEFVDALIACTRDWLTVLKPTGSLWVNLGDKYAGSGGHNNSGLTSPKNLLAVECDAMGLATRRNAPDRYNQSSDGIRNKSLMGLPWRYALRCIDELGLILRAEVIWSKPNGLPESVTDRVRRSHEQWFHFVREGTYFAAIDEIREEYQPSTISRNGYAHNVHTPDEYTDVTRGVLRDRREAGHEGNPLGKAPGSVWAIPSEPLQAPDHLDVDHFAAFPSELPRRIILGWSPTGYCTACGQARRAVVDKVTLGMDNNPRVGLRINGGDKDRWAAMKAEHPDRITGYACACTPYTDHPRETPPSTLSTSTLSPAPPTSTATSSASSTTASASKAPPEKPRLTDSSTPSSGNGTASSRREYHLDRWTPAPTHPAVVLDPFCGTGTVPAVAHLLGRHGIGTDLSTDYLRLAEWRCTSDQRLKDKVLDRSGIPNPEPPAIDGQMDLFAVGGD